LHLQNLFTEGEGLAPPGMNYTHFLALVGKSSRANDFYVDGNDFTGTILAPSDEVGGRGCGASGTTHPHLPASTAGKVS